MEMLFIIIFIVVLVVIIANLGQYSEQVRTEHREANKLAKIKSADLYEIEPEVKLQCYIFCIH